MRLSWRPQAEQERDDNLRHIAEDDALVAIEQLGRIERQTAEPGNQAFRSGRLARVFRRLEHDRMALKLNGEGERLTPPTSTRALQ